MKYHIYMCVFLLLSACDTNFDINQKGIKYPSTNEKKSESNTEASSKQEEDLNKKIKNTLIDDLRNLIETANEHKEKYIEKMKEEPANQYEMGFNGLVWGKGQESASADTERSIRFRRHNYTVLSTIDTSNLKELGNNIFHGTENIRFFNLLNELGDTLDVVTDHLYPKKEDLGKLNISTLKEFKEALKKILSTMKNTSETLNQLLLDYQNDKNLIKTDATKLKSHVDTLFDQLEEKAKEVDKLKNFIINTPFLRF
ncbi:virulence associated lipoprotein [Borreliella carolinensis]|uniref:Virulence associated lipoprotein n=1 Tax=Borreliella carolinensis TaxID=478174 RepID=A0ACD5GK38_9SPIR